MARSLDFYRQLGLDVPDTPEEGHVTISLSNGLRLMLDSEDEIRKFRPEWTRQSGNQLSLALECDNPAEVDSLYAQMISAGHHGDKEPWDAFGVSDTRSSATPTAYLWTSTRPSRRAPRPGSAGELAHDREHPLDVRPRGAEVRDAGP